MRTISPIASAYGLALLLVGCASTSPLTTSFDSLTNESVSKSTPLVEYRSFTSISGLAPSQAVGAFEHAPEGVSPSYAIGVSPKWSYVVQNDYPLKSAAGGTQTSASSLKTLYLTANTYQAQLIVAVAEALTTKDQVDQANNLADAQKQQAYNSLAQKLSVKCAATNCTAAELTAASADKQKAVTDAQKKLDEANQKIAEALSGTNLVITRWNDSSGTKANAGVTSAITASANGDKAKSGIAIFGDLRVLKLYPGEDFLDMVAGFGGGPLATLTDAAGVTTYAILAKQVEYISDLDLQAQAVASLSLTISELESAKKIVAQLVKNNAAINVGIGYSLVVSLSNTGRLSEPTTSVIEFLFYPPAAHAGFVKAELQRDTGYSTIFAVRAIVPEAIQRAARGKLPSTDLARARIKKADPNTASAADMDKISWEGRCAKMLNAVLIERTEKAEDLCKVPDDYWNQMPPKCDSGLWMFGSNC